VLKKLLSVTSLVAALHGLPAFAAQDTNGPGARQAAAPTTQVGVASWYGRSHAGRPTATGERFNPQAMTCAHRTLKLGSVVAVTNVETGTNITCRINDRGPYIRGRVLDLSEQAARRLGVGDRGLLRVRIELVSSGAAGRQG
jgi:rare lipoprotein A